MKGREKVSFRCYQRMKRAQLLQIGRHIGRGVQAGSQPLLSASWPR
jgi:hypothetical protein